MMLVEPEVPFVVAYRALGAALLASDGRLDDARSMIGPLVNDEVLPLASNGDRMTAYRWLPDVLGALGDQDLAAGFLPEVLPYRGQLLVGAEPSLVWGAADRSIGQLLTILGRFDEAEDFFRQAVLLEATVRGRPLVARSRLAWASMYAKRGRPGDSDRVQSLAGQARQDAAALAMVGVERAAHQLLG